MDYTDLLKKQAKEQGNKAYLILREKSYTYRQAYEDSQRFITPAWKNSFPENEKSTVLILTQDLYHQLLAFMALMGAGQIPVIGHSDLPEAAIREIVEKNRIGFVLREGEQGWTLEQGAESGTGEPGTQIKSAVLFNPAPSPYQNACMGVLSSGSTDVPHVMYRTYESWAGFIPEQNRRFLIDENAVVFAEGSFSFTGNLSIWSSVLYAGCTLAVSSVFSCRSWLGMIKDCKVSVLYLVPAKLKMLSRYLREEYPSVRMILAGSQLLGARTAGKLRQYFPCSEVVLYYGASELDYITWLGYDEVLRYPDSVGKPVPGVKVWVEEGLIYIDTPYHVEGLEQPCTLHDTGYFNAEGYLIFKGRESDIINKGGFKISCTKIENTLCALPEVSQAVVLPYNDSGRGQEAAAFVVCETNVSRRELRQYMKTVLMQQEMPKKIIIVDEIPLNSRGKTDKGALQEMLAQKAPVL